MTERPSAADASDQPPPADQPAVPEPPEGGDPACWLERVCPECGRLDDGPPPAVCPGCGTPMRG